MKVRDIKPGDFILTPAIDHHGHREILFWWVQSAYYHGLGVSFGLVSWEGKFSWDDRNTETEFTVIRPEDDGECMLKWQRHKVEVKNQRRRADVLKWQTGGKDEY